MDSPVTALAGEDLKPLRVTFHRTTRVGDHEDPSKQTVATAVENSPACKLIRWPPDGDDKTYLLALDCPPGLALPELDAFGICASTGGPTELGVRLEIKVEGENIAVPPVPRDKPSPASRKGQQDYFFLPNTASDAAEEWIHGIAVKDEPRLVRQFVVRNDGTGASIQHQVTGEVVPEKMGIIEIEATFAPCSAEAMRASPSPISIPDLSFSREPSAAVAVRPDEPEPAPRRVDKYELYAQVFIIVEEVGREPVDHYFITVQCDDVKADDDVRTLKDRVAESLRWELGIGQGQEEELTNRHDDPFDVSSSELVYKHQVLQDSQSLEYYGIYQGSTVDVRYRPSTDPYPTPHLPPDIDTGFSLDIMPASEIERIDSDDLFEFLPVDRPTLPFTARYSQPGRSYEAAVSMPDSMVYSSSPPPSHTPMMDDIEPPVQSGYWSPPPRVTLSCGRDDEAIPQGYDIRNERRPLYLLDGGTLEILPGGLIAQPLSKDPGTYDWTNQPRTKFTVRIVNFEQFRSITNQEPPAPPPLPKRTRPARRDERNPQGTDSVLVSSAEYQFTHPEEEIDDKFWNAANPGKNTPSYFPEKGPVLPAPTINFPVVNPGLDGAQARRDASDQTAAIPSPENKINPGYPTSKEESSGVSSMRDSAPAVRRKKGPDTGDTVGRGGNRDPKPPSTTRRDCCTCM